MKLLPQWCYDALQEDDWCILDTETTGLDPEDEIIEISIIDKTGAVLLDQLVRPFKKVPASATRVHGIDDEMLKHKPSFAKVLPQIVEVLQRFNQVIVYNAEFDKRLLLQSVKKADAQLFMSPKAQDLMEVSRAKIKYACPIQWVCMMEAYAEYWGLPGRYDNSYKWQKLQEACAQQEVQLETKWHRALGDAQATLALIKKLAEVYERQEADTTKRPSVKLEVSE